MQELVREAWEAAFGLTTIWGLAGAGMCLVGVLVEAVFGRFDPDEYGEEEWAAWEAAYREREAASWAFREAWEASQGWDPGPEAFQPEAVEPPPQRLAYRLHEGAEEASEALIRGGLKVAALGGAGVLLCSGAALALLL